MVDLRRDGFDETHQQVYDTTDRHGREKLYPLAARMDAEDWFPEEAFRGLAEIGVLGATLPEAYGGAGMSVLGQAFAAEAMSKWNSSLASSYLFIPTAPGHSPLRHDAGVGIFWELMCVWCSGWRGRNKGANL